MCLVKVVLELKRNFLIYYVFSERCAGIKMKLSYLLCLVKVVLELKRNFLIYLCLVKVVLELKRNFLIYYVFSESCAGIKTKLSYLLCV